jgi:cytochrome c-type biogenesis protein CcmH
MSERRPPLVRHSAGCLAATLSLCVLVAAGPAVAATTRTSLPQIERQVMCVTCKIPLNVAESPQATRERVFIRSLIAKGLDEGQVKDQLVDQYGASVLGLPADHGFNAAAYLVPLAAVVVLAGTFFLLLPRWRRRARAQALGESPPEPLAAPDAARLESDLARFD